jgi:hypothetical protein
VKLPAAIDKVEWTSLDSVWFVMENVRIRNHDVIPSVFLHEGRWRVNVPPLYKRNEAPPGYFETLPVCDTLEEAKALCVTLVRMTCDWLPR